MEILKLAMKVRIKECGDLDTKRFDFQKLYYFALKKNKQDGEPNVTSQKLELFLLNCCEGNFWNCVSYLYFKPEFVQILNM